MPFCKYNSKPFSFLLLMFIGLSLFISGCSSVSNTTKQKLTKQTIEQRSAQLKQLDNWKIKGKIAFIEKDSRHSASLSWLMNEKEKKQQLHLTSYLGINVLQLDSNGNEHTIQFDGETYKGKNLDQLILGISGLTLPTQALSFWLKGIAFTEDDSMNYHEKTNLPTSLISHYNNENWQVNYSNYKQVDNFQLATKFSIKKDDLLIKIVINNWDVVK